MITRLDNVAIGSYFLLVRFGNRYKILSSSLIKDRVQILCKCCDDERIVQLTSNYNVWIESKPKIKLKVKRVHTTS